MGGMVVGVPDGLAELGAQLGVLEGDGLVYGGMAGDIGSEVSECTESKGVFVGILALQEQLADEIAAANVVQQIAEFHAAKGIVAEILDDRASVGVGVCFGELSLRKRRESLEEEWTKITGPEQVYNFLMGKNGVSARTAGTEE